MATYLPGVTDYIPQLQPFRPDFNFYSKALQMKQGKYDANHKRLSSLYGSLLNAPMLRDKNIEQRDQFFKMVNQDIRKMGTMDLSLQQNVDAAAGVFNQLLDDDNIVKDMVWTRNWQNQQKRAESFKNCVDPKKCGGAWWEGGVQALNFRADEFKKASDEDALRMANAQFTPYQDVMKMAIDLAKDAGLNIEIDQLQGRYITTTKNGPMLIKPLQNLFMGSIGKDPKVMEYYRTKAYVDRKGWVAGNAAQYGSEEAAEAAYYNQMTSSMAQFFGESEQSVTRDAENVTAQKKQLEERITKEGTTQTSSLANEYRRLNQLEGEVNASKEVITEGAGSTRVAGQNGYSRGAVEMTDRALATYYMGMDIGKAAQTLAYKDYKFSMKADPYALENVRQANRLSLENVKLQGRFALEKYKYDLDAYAEKVKAVGSDIDNIPSMQVLGDAAFANLSPEAQAEAVEKARTDLQKEISGPEKKLTSDAINLMQVKAKTENGSGAATSDLLELADAFVNQAAATNSDSYFASGGSSASGKEFKKKWDGWSNAEKVKFATSAKFTSQLNSADVPGSVIDEVYTNHVAPKLDMTKQTNAESRGYLKHLWANSETERAKINVKNHVLDNLDEWQASSATAVLDQVKSNDPEAYKTLKHLVDPETGRPRNIHDFATSYAQMKVDESPDTRVVEDYKPASERGSTYMASGMDLKMDRRIEGVGYTKRTVKVNKEQVRADAYKEARKLYDAKKETSTSWGSYIRAGWNMATNDPVEAGQVLVAGTTVSSRGALDLWKQMYGRYAEPEGNLSYLSGFSSEGVMGLNFPAMDPAKYMSGATQNTLSFLKNSLATESKNMSVSISGADDDDARAIMQQLTQDIMTQTSDKKLNRPMLDVTYQDIADANGDWTALTVKFNTPYMKQYRGSEKNPGLMRPYEEALRTSGMTIKLKKDAANNLFSNGVGQTATEKALFYSGKHDFNSYPQVSDDFTMDRTENGWAVSGNVNIGVDENGQNIAQPFYQEYNDPRTDVNQIIGSFDEMLREYSIDLSQMTQQYNFANGIKDPSQLLQQ